MAISATGLRDEIILLFPPTWSWIPTQSNYDWLTLLCSGFRDMWIAGTLTTGTCGGSPPTPHTHTLATLTPALMSAPPKTLGFSAIADLFVDAIAAETASFLLAGTTLDVLFPDACVPHTHTFTSFGTDSVLAGVITSEAALIGAAGPGISPWATAFASGLVAHLLANAALDIVTHPVQHTLS